MTAPTVVQPDIYDALAEMHETPVLVKSHDTSAVLHAVMTDPLPSRQDDRAHIEAAIRKAAADNDGLVHISTVRQHLKREVFPNMLGAVLRPRAGFLEATGSHLPNGGGSGNAHKLAPVYRLVEES